MMKQADWLILREFRPDLLMEETPASLWHRLSTPVSYTHLTLPTNSLV